MPQFYANPKPIYQPAMRLIASITNSNPSVVTTTFDHNYKAGTVIRFDIPSYIGMQQANLQTASIVAILGPTSFSTDLDTRSFEPFAIPSPLPAHATTTALSVPVGEINSTLAAATQNILPFS